jgi:hypothetical protein
MKLYHKYLLMAGVIAATTLTSCLDESFPQNSTVTGDQLGSDVPGLSAGISAYMTTYSSWSSASEASDIGFMAFLIRGDAMCGELPVYATTYDYFRYWTSQTYLGDWYIQSIYWSRYYSLIKKANDVLSISTDDYDSATNLRNYDSDNAAYIGDALGYRAWAYEQISEMYEYQATGVASLDASADATGLYGITVPLVTEKTTEKDTRNNPRLPFYSMYRFINQDLIDAIGFLSHSELSATNKVRLGTAYGLAARLWLRIATRFDKHPADLATQLAHEDDPDLEQYAALGVTNATEAYARAAEYARLAINRGFTPLTRAQWYDPKTGFNTPNNAWMWGIIISASDPITDEEWQSFCGFISMEPTYGVASFYPTDNGDAYKAGRMIDANLFKQISPADWRRATWIDPADVGSKEAYENTYKAGTNLSYTQWAYSPGYAGNKFHPGGGNCTNAKEGNTISVPLMRVEEMYLIEAEAVAHSQGAGAGKALLEQFMNSYRTESGGYTCAAADLDGVVEEIFTQKRIEFWGEGIVYSDYRRLEHAIVKAYEGTNHPKEYQFNSYDGYVAPWTTFYIPSFERNMNPAIIPNPDPTDAIPQTVTYTQSFGN